MRTRSIKSIKCGCAPPFWSNSGTTMPTICISIFLLCIIVGTGLYFIGAQSTPIPNTEIDVTITSDSISTAAYNGYGATLWQPNVPYITSTLYGDELRGGGFGFGLGLGVLGNPTIPPVNDPRYLVPGRGHLGPAGIVASIATSSDLVTANYRQVGMLTPLNGEKKNNVLPLMGKPLFTRRGLWNYYAISNQQNEIKLPVTIKGKSGVNEYGVDEVSSGDAVYVQGYDEVFRVTLYTTAAIQYVPY